MNVVKEIRVTDSFLGLEKDIRGCQTVDSFENCTTNAFVETSLEFCGCLPFNIRQSENVGNSTLPNYQGIDTQSRARPRGAALLSAKVA